MDKEPILNQIVGVGLPLLALAGIATLSVSPKTRRLIRNRDGGCVDQSGEPHFGILEVSHIDHTRNDKYEDDENLSLLCTRHHLVEHLQREGKNGLTTEQNTWAIKQICIRLAGMFLVENET